jgi:Na+-driven multidrug efflux pump
MQFFIASGSWIVLTRLVAEIGGKDASSGYQIALRNAVFFILPAWGLSNAAATLVGQNLGAKQPERASQSVLLTAKYNAVFMSGVMVLFVLFASPIISIFTKDNAVQEVGRVALQIIGTGYIFYGIGMVMIQALNGRRGYTDSDLDSFCRILALSNTTGIFYGEDPELGFNGSFYCHTSSRNCDRYRRMDLF